MEFGVSTWKCNTCNVFLVNSILGGFREMFIKFHYAHLSPCTTYKFNYSCKPLLIIIMQKLNIAEIFIEMIMFDKNDIPLGY